TGDNLDDFGKAIGVFTSASAGKVTGHATVTLVVGGVTLVRETDGTHDNSSNALKRFVDAKITLTPLTSTNGIGEKHTITATVLEDDGLNFDEGGDGVTGFTAAPNGTLVSFSLSNSGGATGAFVGSSDCTINNGNGTCTVDINSPTAGTVTINGSTMFTVSGISVTRDTDPLTTTVSSGPGGGGPVTKIYVDGTLRWLKHDDKGAPLGGATFLVTHTVDRFGNPISNET